jgi:branched-chain amino acid transport system substrate-binding protein
MNPFGKTTRHRGRDRIKAVELAAVLALVLAACGSGPSSSSNAPSGPINIGYNGPITGHGSHTGVGLLEGASVALQAINDAGGVMGRKVQLISGDNRTDPVDAIPVAQQQISIDHIVASLGPASTELVATKRYYDAGNIPIALYGGDTTYDKLSDPLIWKVTPSDSVLGVAMALYAHKAGYQRAVMLFDTTDASQQLKNIVTKTWTKLGGTVAATVDYAAEQNSYRSEVAKVIAAKPDVILFYMTAPTMGVMFANLEELNGLTIPMVGDDSSIGPSFINAVGLANHQKVVTSLTTGDVSSPGLDFFNQLYQKKMGHGVEPNANYGYDGITMLALAIQKAQSTDGQAIARAIQQIENPNNEKVYTFAQGLAALKAGKSIKYVGVSGPLDFDANHQVYGPFGAYKATDANGGTKLIMNLTADELKAAAP